MSYAGLPPTRPSSDIEEVINVAGRRYNEHKTQAPQVPDNHRILQSIFAFVLALFESIYLMVTTIATNLSRRISAVESSIETLQQNDEEETVELSAASAAPPTTTTTCSTRSARPKRCQKCHARGHDAIECRTTNPSAMRRRVASNSRIAKETRANTAMPNIPAPAPTFIPWQYPQSMPSSPYPVNYANLVADATELRRRAAQSSRDRRLHRRRHSSTMS